MRTGEADLEPGELRVLLLRRLSEAQALPLRERVLLDEEFAARVQDEEYALLDDYARGGLAAADRTAVEQYLLVTPVGRERLILPRALTARARRKPPRVARPQWFMWLAPVLAACVAVIVAGIWWGVAERGAHEAPAATVTLLAEVSRGAAAPVSLEIPARGLVRLQAEVVNPPAGARYRLEVLDAEGHSLYSASGLAVRRAGPYQYVETRVPAALLGPGPSRVEVSGPGYTFNWVVQTHH